LSEDTQRAGVVASSFLHAALLAFIVVGFASAPRFDDAAETIPVDTVTKDQFAAIMKGELNAKAPRTTAPVAPQPPTPPEAPPDLRKAEETPPPEPPKPPTPEPPKPPAPEPPPRPEPSPPPKPEPPKLVPPTPPSPPLRPEPPPKPDALETPPPRPKTVETTPPQRPKETPPERPKPDQLAKLMAKDKSEEPAKDPSKDSAKPVAKPYDPKAIAKLIGESKPTSAPAGSPANLGAPAGHAPHMSGSQARALDEWFKDAYMSCWSPPPSMPEGETYIPEIQVEFSADGSLSGQPVLVNPPSDPAWRAHAESAMRAALRCNPLKVPQQYAPFFEQWRTKTIHFDPREALG
jgi:hypothetical protein